MLLWQVPILLAYSGGQNRFNVVRTLIVLLITHEGKMIKS
jgi:hypothetical protein